MPHNFLILSRNAQSGWFDLHRVIGVLYNEYTIKQREEVRYERKLC